MNEDKIIHTAVWGYGKDVQTWKCVEEYGEILTALARLRISEIRPELSRGGEETNLIEELADIGIMSEQLNVIYGFPKAVKVVRHRKLKRLADRLGIKEDANED